MHAGRIKHWADDMLSGYPSSAADASGPSAGQTCAE